MAKRKHISWKTKCAAALMVLHRFPYDDAKQMTEDQFLSLWQWDHNIFHHYHGISDVVRGIKTLNISPDTYWNLLPRLIQEHREKTKTDMKIIAKSRRIRARLAESERALTEKCGWRSSLDLPTVQLAGAPDPNERVKRKLRSRGFDKTKTRKFSGKVVERKR